MGRRKPLGKLNYGLESQKCATKRKQDGLDGKKNERLVHGRLKRGRSRYSLIKGSQC